jgi:hypothetical protein
MEKMPDAHWTNKLKASVMRLFYCAHKHPHENIPVCILKMMHRLEIIKIWFASVGYHLYSKLVSGVKIHVTH